MIQRNKRSKSLVAEINVVPYIDVMLVLLVIFIVTAPLLQQGVVVDLPKASAKVLPPTQEEPIVVSVDQRGDYYLNIADLPHRVIDKEALVVRVMAALARSPERKILVKADAHVDYGKVVGVMTLLQQAGSHTVGLVTEDESA